MSKKGKVSSGKKTKKNSAKSPKKKGNKPGKTASKKKPSKKALPKKSLKAKKAIKKTKPASKKIIGIKLQPKIKTVTVIKEKIDEVAKKPFYIKKDEAPIPEFKPIIKPTIKTDSSNKDGYPTTIKNTSASSFITTPSKKADSYSIKPEKEPNGKFELEFVIKASGELLYEFLITPSGLSEWFAEDVNIRDEVYTFFWDAAQQQAKVIGLKDEEYIRFRWLDRKDDGTYFEFKIIIDDLTSDLSLIVTDFAENESEKNSSSLLWSSQVGNLMKVLGSYY